MRVPISRSIGYTMAMPTTIESHMQVMRYPPNERPSSDMLFSFREWSEAFASLPVHNRLIASLNVLGDPFLFRLAPIAKHFEELVLVVAVEIEHAPRFLPGEKNPQHFFGGWRQTIRRDR